MMEDQRELLEEARDSIAAARLLLEGERMAFSKHSAVIAAFGQHFANTGKVPANFHRYLLEAQELRHSGDYGPRDAVTPDKSRQQIERAEQFLQLAEDLIGPVSTTGKDHL